jgi:3D (Asp-Asp-Asp) domain-containing protein
MSINNQNSKIANFAVILAIMADLLFPKVGSAESVVPQINNSIIGSEIKQIETKINPGPHLTRSNDAKPKKVIYVTVTAYSSTVDQCDSTPFITASGTRVHDGTLAANFLPFGTRVRLPDYSGEKIFIVEDRMHPRFSQRSDIWMETRETAKQFGIKRLKMEIF